MLVKFINRKTSLTQFSRFLDIKKTKLVNEGETAVLSCQVDAFPYNSETVSWFRDGYDIGKIILLYLFHHTMQTNGKMQKWFYAFSLMTCQNVTESERKIYFY